jgi:hypothetical protein
MKYTQNGSYVLKKLKLDFEGDDVSYNLIPLYLDISIYESMFSVGMSGNITIMDSNSLYNENFLGNGERITIVFETAGTNKEISVTGIVYKCSPPTRINEHTSGLLLYFCSDEVINNLRSRVSKSYTNVCSSIVKDLHESISTKKLKTTPTKEINHFVGANQHPVDVIGNLARRSMSTTNEGGYLYFENNQEFCFLPIEYLYKQAPVTQYKYKNAGVYDDVDKKEEESFSSIQDYSIIDVPDFMQQIDDGVLGSKTTNFNILEKSISTSSYDNVSQFSTTNSLAKVANLNNDLVSSDNKDKLYTYIDDVNKPFHEFRLKNINILLNTQRYAARITVFGDTNNICGSIIQCYLPVWGTSANKGEIPDPYSGKFLVAEIKHTLKRNQYTQTMKLVKDAFEVGK